MFKKIITPLVLASFLTVAFFGFVAMSYGPDGRMQGDCPFSATGASLCPQNAPSGAIHHLSAYQSFISVPMNSGITALIIALLIVVCVALVFSFHPFLYKSLIRVGYFYDSPPISSRIRKIMRWLSLLENSPSFR